MTSAGRAVVASESEATRRMVGVALAAAGFEVVEAHSSFEVLRLAQERSVQLLVLDLSRKPWVGLVLLEAVRGECWTLPVLVITGDTGGSAVAEARRLNIQGTIATPLDGEGIRRAVIGGGELDAASAL